METREGHIETIARACGKGLIGKGGGCWTGFVMDCTYEVTNLSFARNYPVPITIIDIAWGTSKGIFAGFYVFYLIRYFSS